MVLGINIASWGRCRGSMTSGVTLQFQFAILHSMLFPPRCSGAWDMCDLWGLRESSPKGIDK